MDLPHSVRVTEACGLLSASPHGPEFEGKFKKSHYMVGFFLLNSAQSTEIRINLPSSLEPLVDPEAGFPPVDHNNKQSTTYAKRDEVNAGAISGVSLSGNPRLPYRMLCGLSPVSCVV